MALPAKKPSLKDKHRALLTPPKKKRAAKKRAITKVVKRKK
jgi:hypothetical protein